MNMTILILGFYDKQNLGDNLFIPVFQHILGDNLIFESIDSFNDYTKLPDVIVCGGGDIINDYFIQKIRAIVHRLQSKSKKPIPVYAIGVGFPYPSLINENYLDIFDFILTRNKSIQLPYPKIISIPDLVTYLPEVFSEPTDVSKYGVVGDQYCTNCSKSRKNIGFFLARPIYSEYLGVEIYNNLLQKFAAIARFFSDSDVHLFAMNTSDNSSESDLIINDDLAAILENDSNSSIKICRTDIKPADALSLFRSLDFVVCTRFHAHVLAIITKTPFLSISCTQKVRLLLKENSLEDLAVNMYTDSKTLAPTDFNLDLALGKLKNIFPKCVLKNSLKDIKKRLHIDSSTIPDLVKNLVLSDIIMSRESVVEQKIDRILQTGEATPEKISFVLTGNIESSYSWGLQQNMLKEFNLHDSVKWILDHQYKNRDYSFLNRSYSNLFNINYFDSDNLEELHRAGWSYVMKGLEWLGGELIFENFQKSLIFDPFLDKTFGWRKDFYIKMNMLPIKHNWIGVFHHTPNQEYSSYNLTDVFTDPIFQESLKSCKGLIVLSDYLKKWCETKTDVPILSVKHPTESVENRFTMKKFHRNDEKKVIQVGAWLRDSYAIYDLPELDFLKKAVLKGKKMENYFPDCNTSYPPTACRTERGNRYFIGLQNAIRRRLNSVKTIEYLKNDEYDELLSKNVVFLNLVDASAVNTLIECIVRNTPIVINPLPAVVEYLGENYPLYYNTLEEASRLLNSIGKISEGYEYLKRMDKSELRLESFLDEIEKFVRLVDL
jgi:hypothetical protein